jgi:Flp pilus assembly protein TadD
MARDYHRAEQQLLQAGEADRIDSAWLINYGLVLLRTGRHADAERVFRRAAELDDGELELADGRVVTSREAALAAMRQLKVSLAGR